MSKKQPFSAAELSAMGLVEISPGVWQKPNGKLFKDPNKTEDRFKYLRFEKDHIDDINARKENANEYVFIPYQVPSKKNSQNIGRNRKTRKPILYKSKQYINYKTVTRAYWNALRDDFKRLLVGKGKPYKISMEFVRSTRQRFDWIGGAETVQDLMVEYGWLDDDNYREMLPYPEDVSVDKNKPGVYIRVL